MPGKLVLDVCNGLGNRLSAILSAWVVAEARAFTLEIRWRKSKSDGVWSQFSDLFIAPENSALTVIDTLGESPEGESITAFTPTILSRLSAGDTVYVCGKTILAYKQMPDWQFYDNIRELFSKLQIASGVSSKLSIPNTPYIGLHVRLSDHLPAHIATPKSAYRNILSSIQDSYENQTIWICGDDTEFINSLPPLYPGLILKIAKSAKNSQTISRQSVEGIQYALADMIQLSKSRLILASTFSSFSTIAASLGRTRLHRITAINLLSHRICVHLLWKLAAKQRDHGYKILTHFFRSRLFQNAPVLFNTAAIKQIGSVSPDLKTRHWPLV